MTEIEKMFENAGIKKCNRLWPCPFENKCDEGCEYHWYPDFTAEKQLELIKLIANRKSYPDYEYFGNLFDDYIQFLQFDEALARLVNNLWQSLTDQEKEEIRRILNENS